jgi:hypothetical protein
MHISINYKGKLRVSYDRFRSESEHLHILLQENGDTKQNTSMEKTTSVYPACIVSRPMEA